VLKKEAHAKNWIEERNFNMKLKKGIYRHYKGNLYEVLMTAQHSETEEWMVVYKALYGEEGIWVRPYEMFMEKVEVEGVWIPRFEKIEGEC
jgi:hypothetical protein